MMMMMTTCKLKIDFKSLIYFTKINFMIFLFSVYKATYLRNVQKVHSETRRGRQYPGQYVEWLCPASDQSRCGAGCAPPSLPGQRETGGRPPVASPSALKHRHVTQTLKVRPNININSQFILHCRECRATRQMPISPYW